MGLAAGINELQPEAFRSSRYPQAASALSLADAASFCCATVEFVECGESVADLAFVRNILRYILRDLLRILLLGTILSANRRQGKGDE